MASNSREARVFPAPVANVLNAVRNATQAGMGFTYMSEYPYNNGAVVVTMKHGASFSSWGETITVTIMPNGSQTTVDILSECALPTQIVDWGKNKENINKLFGYIQQQCYTPQGYYQQQGYQQQPAYQQPQQGYQQQQQGYNQQYNGNK